MGLVVDRGWVVGSWDAHLASPADFFAGADDITKRESLGSRLACDTERTLESTIITS